MSLNIFIKFNKSHTCESICRLTNESPYIKLSKREITKSEFKSTHKKNDFQFYTNGEIEYKDRRIKISVDFLSSFDNIVFIHNYFSEDSEFFFDYPYIFDLVVNSINQVHLLGHDNFHEISYSSIKDNSENKSWLEKQGLSLFFPK